MENNLSKLVKNMLAEYTEIINLELEKEYKYENRTTKKLYDAQRYSLLCGGKRIRPALVMETCRIFGGEDKCSLPFALAIEMIHTYSLIHDDLPCMDNDEYRRGQLTNHKVFGEAYAILAADGLLTDAFAKCAMNTNVSGECAAAAVGILSMAAGSRGMVMGQAIDMYGEENKLSQNELDELHENKTGALFCGAVQLGCLAAGITPAMQEMRDLTRFAQKIGLVFQIVDDVLDITSNKETLGKHTGADANQNKTTYMTFYSIEQAMDLAVQYTNEAVEIISKYKGSENLCNLALYLCQRQN